MSQTEIEVTGLSSDAEHTLKTEGVRAPVGSVRTYLLGRVGITAVVLLLSVLGGGFRGSRLELGVLLGLFATQVLTAAISLRARELLRDSRFLVAQLGIDVVLTNVLLASEGVGMSRSPFFSLYFLTLLIATQLVPFWGQGILLGLSVGGYVGVVAWPTGLVLALIDEAVQLRIFAMLLVVMLSSLLTLQVRRSTARQLRRREQEVRDIRSRQELLLDELTTGVLVIGADGHVVTLNPAAQRLLGDVGGRPWRELLNPGRDTTWEERDASGRVLFCSRNALEAGGDVVLVEDVSNIRRMEAEVERMERLAAVGRLAAGLAHEIRNPLASLSGSVQLLAEDRPDPLFPLVLGEVDRLNRLVEDFLDVSRPLRLERSEVDLVPLAREVVQTFSHDPRYAERVEVGLELCDSVLVHGDGGRLRQVLWNLLLNAAQHAPMDGHVQVRLACADQGTAVMEVRDDGVGIPAEDLRSIFDPFYTTRVGGTGLGLATVERIVTAHDGRVSATSEVGEGTCFRVELPAQESRNDGEHA